MRPQAVIFDIGKVLLEWDPEPFYDRVIGQEQRRALFEAVDLYTMNEAVDLGAHFQDTVYALADQHPEWQNEIRMWHDRWIEMAHQDIPHSARLLRALKAKGVPVFSLTNFGIQTLELAGRHYSVLTEFDREYVSGHLQVIKPDPAIYEALERDCAIPPEALIFTDDRPENTAAAAARGWQVHLFDGPQGWADRLVQTGLLTPQESA